MSQIPPYDLLRTAVRDWLKTKRWGTINNPFEGAIPRWRKFLKPHYKERFGDENKVPSLQLLYAIFYGVRGMPEDLYGLMTEEFGFECPWWHLRPIDPDLIEHTASDKGKVGGVRQSEFPYARPRRREAKR